jgi:N-acetylglucosamine-6-phosphate deacetylase
VRNVVAWSLATPEQAVGLATTNPAALLAPALASHGIGLANGSLEWDAALRPRVLTRPG